MDIFYIYIHIYIYIRIHVTMYMSIIACINRLPYICTFIHDSQGTAINNAKTELFWTTLYVYTHIYIYTYIYIYIYIYMYTYTWNHVDVYNLMYTHISIYIYTFIHDSLGTAINNAEIELFVTSCASASISSIHFLVYFLPLYWVRTPNLSICKWYICICK
jgi:hypothetical protein